MKIKLIGIVSMIVSMLFIGSCTTVQGIYDSNVLTNKEIIQGLKEALTVGTDSSVKILHSANGYYNDRSVRISLPLEADVLYKNISLIPGGPMLLDDLIHKVNKAAEDAASEASPIFVDAIAEMTIEDGLTILRGADTAATVYLKQSTDSLLTTAFEPKIRVSLSKVIVGNMSAQSAYANLIDTYNKAAVLANMVPGIKYSLITSNSLSMYTTQKALDGLFLKIAEEEKSIRKDPAARVTAVLKKVFSERLY